ncbi:carbohydrate esterase family 8 protein [Punctularia strigosozonata HHB-11173 SS5]|uniref:pectinesterase n=1 Tax=Punctularia strigosozonata (strain HHB-11173) TaxID=741275 RepID=R7S2L7_PUNST|nr:carbohydrate esterase family 8 protein [Punctularia strigosozonata HHB-11173 SS5]EIN03491.1 carbohydrate esterase family 8 protein [Punctularia strigosozonata HHB-11173 SS5]
MVALALLVLLTADLVLAGIRIAPPRGALVVRPRGTQPGEFTSISAAVNALSNDTSPQSVFIYPGTYAEQVNITRSGPTTLYGYTLDTATYALNTVTLTDHKDATTAGSNDLSGTLRIEAPHVALYNLDVRNTFGLPRGVNQANQAIALSNYGDRVGVYGCGLYGYQDVLLANQGAQVYLRSRIEGGIDFVFGRLGQAYFKHNTIAVTAPANVTASGRQTNDSGIYLFERNALVKTADAWANTSGNVYFGRPWGDYARVVFKSTFVTVPMAPKMWNPWHPGDERTDHVLFAEHDTYGPGVPAHPQRPNFTTLLTDEEASRYNITFALGNGWADWVDESYL